MKFKRKFILLAMVLVMSLALVVGCGSSGNDGEVSVNNGGSVGSGSATLGEGKFSRADLEAIYGQLVEANDNFTLSEMTYDNICENYFDGEEGKYVKMGEKTDSYNWYANDEELVSVTVYFDDFGDGIKVGSGVSSYFP